MAPQPIVFSVPPGQFGEKVLNAPPDLTVAQDGRAEEITPGALFKADIEFRGRTLDLPHVSAAHEAPGDDRRTRPERRVPDVVPEPDGGRKLSV